jgi:amino acid adenylation domain-containing protein/thioester reductase-like protein
MNNSSLDAQSARSGESETRSVLLTGPLSQAKQDASARADAHLPALLPEEAQCLERWQRGSLCRRPEKRVHELFENLVDQHPQRIAIVTDSGTRSYADLEQHANRIARTLLSSGIAREEPVAVFTECSADLPATVLGIWKAGAAYLPLAPELPPARLAYMAQDSRARLLIALDGRSVPAPLAAACQTILRPESSDWAWDRDIAASPTARPASEGAAQDLAYIIYTSGTTGMPKGVLIQHDALVNATYSSGESFGLTPADRVSLVATPGFDASLWELGMGLLHGMAIVPVPQALREDPWALQYWYQKHGVTVAFHTPSYLRVSKQMTCNGLRILLTGGEAPTHDDARQYAGHLEFWNAYGPTETCIFVCAERLLPNPDGSRPLSVGRPLPNTCISIRRDDGTEVPPGVLGEVWIGGVGVARGYLNNPDLTAKAFVATRDGRFYRSGDLGRWTDAGRLELAGRIDDQIKWHGQRMEPGEIEHALHSHPAVAEAIVLLDAAAHATKVLRAFVRLHPTAATPTVDQWRSYLSERLALHMVPAAVTCVATLPLTVAGKIDRNALLALPREHSDAPARTPGSVMETRVAAVWQELLGNTAARVDNFFALGGNSLLAVTMAHRLSSELAVPIPARELFAAPTLAGFASRLELLCTGHVAQLAPPVRSNLATQGQREFRVAEAAGLDTRTFIIPLLRAVNGAMPTLDRWNRAWAALVARHASLRTYFNEDADGRLQRAAVPSLSFPLETATAPNAAAARALIRERQYESFAMGVPPLWRAGLVTAADCGKHWFWLALHHSVGDGRSIGIIIEELGALLRGEQLASLGCDFAASAGGEAAYLAGPACAEDARYWAELLARQPAAAFDDGPLDFPRSLVAKTGNHRFETRLDAVTCERLQTLARQHAASLHAVMLTLFALEARRRTGRTDCLIGTAASLRETHAEAQVIGCYVNMLPVPCHLPRDISFGTALREMQQTLAAGLQHLRYPFARIYQDFRNAHDSQRHPLRYPLFDLAVIENPRVVIESLGSGASGQFSRESLAYELTEVSPGQDLILSHEALADGSLLLQLHANAALYSRETTQCWFDALQDWAAWLVADHEHVHTTLPALLPREAALLERWEPGAQATRPALRFHELFERVLDANPEQADQPAVITQSGITTYAALEREANSIAHRLLLDGATRSSIVGVMTTRSANLPAAVLGIWKAGAVYLPLGADLPPERLARMAQDAGSTFLIALDGLVVPPELARGLPAVLRPEDIDVEFRRTHAQRPHVSGNTEDAAYIIYTSGSTGAPKGTLIGHDAYLNTLLSTGEILGLTRHDRCLMFAAPSFDVSLSDLGMPLAFGAALCPIPREVLASPNRFRDFLSELEVTVADITPTYLRLFDGAALPSLRILITGGEPPYPADVQTYASRHRYFNAYGPTENTITSTLRELQPQDSERLSAGRPLPNTSVHVLDADGHRVAPGVVGELWLGGIGVARGYVGRPELTAAAFVATDGARRYRSGDRARWHRGEIEVLGRSDEQVKLNGIRIELNEIEHALACHPHIAQASAILDDDAQRSHSLWGFVRLRPGQESPTPESWRDFLAARLPAGMIPSAVFAIPVMPLSSSGKVDKTALRRLLAERSRHREVSAPEAGLETQIAALWSEVLGCGPVQRDDNFFALGGHSLLAIAMSHRLETTLGMLVPARELFAEPTLRGFAARVSKLSAPLTTQSLSDRATAAQHEFWVAEQAGLDTRGFIVSVVLSIGGAAPPIEQWRRAWSTLVARHAALRTAFCEDRDGVLRRRVSPELDAEFEHAVLSDTAAALAHIEARRLAAFSMQSAPLGRAGLVTAGATESPVCWLALHHCVSDGVSIAVLSEELACLLNGATLPPVADGFDHTAAREESYFTSAACAEDALYWRNLIGSLDAGSGAAAWDEWSLDFPRPPGRTARSSQGTHCLSRRLTAATRNGLRELAQRNGATLHAVMLTIVAHEVWRRTERSAFLLGTVVSMRDSAAEARSVGCHVNQIAVPCRLHGQESFERSLCALQRSLADGLQHARYPFARIYRDLRRDPARHPFFSIAVTENPTEAEAHGGADDRLHFNTVQPQSGAGTHYQLRPPMPAQDMILVHQCQPDGSLLLQWHVDAALYERDTAESWLESLAGWAYWLANRERLPGSPLPALLPEEEDLLADWEHGPVLAHPAPSLPACVEHWASIQPDRPALVTERGTQSYAVLNARANALAHPLRAAGLGRDERVGVLTDRSVHLPAVVLAIWKAGGCYLPLVKDLPPERLAFIAREADIKVLMVLDGLEIPAALAAIACVIIRPELVLKPLTPNDHGASQAVRECDQDSNLACVLYTSGSTGEPKGVLLHHLGITNLGVAGAAAMGIRADDRILVVASPAFDLWLADVAIAWSTGAALVPLASHEVHDLAGVRDKIARLGVTTASMTPSYLRMFQQAQFPGLRLLMTVGEPPHLADVRHYAAHLSYINGYGPTENSAAASIGVVSARARRMTAGRTLGNTSIHIRGNRGQPVPPGAVGCIWLSGMGVAAGYLNRPDLTAQQFVATPQGRLYCTGDLGRWTRDGELAVLGRADEQVKLRGQRVELAEIEQRLATHPCVRQALAAVETRAGMQTLWAFVCLHAGAVAPTQAVWRDYLANTLPSYMLPAAVIVVPAIPVTTSGKADRAALLHLRADLPRSDARTQPSDARERCISEAWAEHLDCQCVAREDNFFDLGGNSLSAIAVVNQLRRRFDCHVNALYEHPRLADFAGHCRPRPEHLRALLQSAQHHWQDYREGLTAYDAERDAALAVELRDYTLGNQRYTLSGKRRSYGHVLLTGATGYLGSYLLRELLADGERQVVALVRGHDAATARARLGEVLLHYFGMEHGTALLDSRRLTVLAGDLRRDDLGVSHVTYQQLANEVQAVFHCAANVKHYGHYGEFHADNVAATERLLKLAAHRQANPADFHFVSTLSTCGRAPEQGFRIFTEDHAVSAVLDDNYYVRSKQEAERLVVSARQHLTNACIHRVGNLVFAAQVDAQTRDTLQSDIRDNAFFRLVAAFMRLGVAPDDAHLWLCHVDVVARALVQLAEAAELTHATHHLENARRDTLAIFFAATPAVQLCGFDTFLQRLAAAVDEPDMEPALNEALEAFGLYRGVSPQPRARRLEIVSARTQQLLAQLGMTWPEVPAARQAEMLRLAAELFCGRASA